MKNKGISIKILSVFLAIIFFAQVLPAFAFNVSATDVIDTNDSNTNEESDSDTTPLIIDPDADYEDNKVIVTFKKEYSDPEIEVTAEWFPDLEIESIENYIISDPDENFTRDIIITLSEHDKNGVMDACETISQRNDVHKVYPSYYIEVELCDSLDDKYFDQYYDEHYEAHSLPYTLVQAHEAWETTTGSSSVKVAVIDTKVDNHNDLNANLVTGYDAVNKNTITNDFADDHGTKVASVIGAQGNNDIFSRGICWDVSIYPVQIFTYLDNELEIPSGAFLDILDELKANNVFIANCSFGMGYVESIPELIQKIDDWGGIIVAAAGNGKNGEVGKDNDNSPVIPASVASDHIISVAAYNYNGTALASFSNYGKESVDIAAPGQDIYLLTEGNESGYSFGTSYAAPFVTGAAALLKSAHPEATSEEIIAALKLGSMHFSWTENKIKYGCLKIASSMNKLEEILECRKSVDDGTYIVGSADNSFQVMDIVGGSIDNGANTVIYEANGTTSQKFEIEYHVEDYLEDYYTIKSVNSGKYLEAANDGTSAGIAVQQNSWTGSDTQKWIIEAVSDDEYIIKNKHSMLALDFGVSSPANGQAVTLQTAANSADQKFRIIPSGDNIEIPDGLYTISCKNNSSLYFNNTDDNICLGYLTSTRFKLENHDGYCYISEYYGDKSIDLANGQTAHLTNIIAATDNPDIDTQKWVIKDGGDGYAYIVAYGTNKVMGTVESEITSGTNITLYTPTGDDSQRFNFIKENVNSTYGLSAKNIEFGEYLYAVTDENSGIDISTNLLYDISEGTIPYAFERQPYGAYTIRNTENGLLLSVADDGSVIFSEADGSERQLWEIHETDNSGSSFHYFNVYTQRYLKYTENSDGSIQVTTAIDEYDEDYYDIKFINYPNIQEGVEYLIIPKNDPQKAITIDDSTQASQFPITISNIDFTNNKQKYIFEFSGSDNTYTIRNVQYSEKWLNYPGIDLPICASSRAKDILIIQTTDGYFKFVYRNRCYQLEDSGIKYLEERIENDDNQKFMLVPVSDIIENGTYQILLGNDSTKALSVDTSLNDNTTVTIENSSTSDKSQEFYVYYENGSYHFINLYSGKALSLSNDLNSIVQNNINSNDISQKWQIINTSENDSDYTAKLVSYRNGDYLLNKNGSLATSFYTDFAGQTFTLKRRTELISTEVGEIVSTYQTTKDISISNTNAVLSQISTNGRTSLDMTNDDDGFWIISEKTNGTVLDATNNTLTFAASNSSDYQRWIITNTVGNTFVIINVATGKYLTNNNGELSLTHEPQEAFSEFNIYIKGDINADTRVNTADIILIRKIATNEYTCSEVERYCADLNLDGTINSRDIILLRYKIAGLTDDTETSNETSTYSLRNSENTNTQNTQFTLTDREIAEMTDEEFLEYLFGDVDYDSLTISVFD